MKVPTKSSSTSLHAAGCRAILERVHYLLDFATLAQILRALAELLISSEHLEARENAV